MVDLWETVWNTSHRIPVARELRYLLQVNSSALLSAPHINQAHPCSQQKPPGIFRCQQWDAICVAHRSGEWQANMGRALTMSASRYI